MANGHNLFISYDLMAPGKNYEAVATVIKALGSWAKPNLSYWFVDSAYTAQEAAKRVWAVMDPNDKLVVVDTKANQGCWFNIDTTVSDHMVAHWNY